MNVDRAVDTLLIVAFVGFVAAIVILASTLAFQ